MTDEQTSEQAPDQPVADVEAAPTGSETVNATPAVAPTPAPEQVTAAPAPTPSFAAEIRTWWDEVTNHPDMPSPAQQHPFVFLETKIEGLIAELESRLKALL